MHAKLITNAYADFSVTCDVAPFKALLMRSSQAVDALTMSSPCIHDEVSLAASVPSKRFSRWLFSKLIRLQHSFPSDEVIESYIS